MCTDSNKKKLSGLKRLENLSRLKIGQRQWDRGDNCTEHTEKKWLMQFVCHSGAGPWNCMSI